MAISYTYPYAFILIPILVLFVLFTSRWVDRIQKLRKKIAVLLRCFVFILLALALAGINIKWETAEITTIVAVDRSDSMTNSNTDTRDFVKKALASKPGGEQIGILTFGGNAEVETFVSKSPEFVAFETDVAGSHTNIENACATSISLFPENSRKRIVLITDGQENAGNVLKLAPTILDMGIDLKVYKTNRDIKNEVALESINVPSSLNAGENFSITININSRIKTNATLTLFTGREKTLEEKVELRNGSNRFVFKDTASGPGLRIYRAVIQPDMDTIFQNNEALAVTNINDKARVLVIEDTHGEADELVKILKGSNIDYRLSDAASAPSSLTEMSAYKTIITCNVSAENLSDGFLNSLEPYVKDFGGGFVAAGGENSFALGGYYKTPLEKVLPVNMDLKGNKETPDMAMMLIIDKSGSMSDAGGGLPKVDLAKEAAARVLDSLRPGRDEIGIIAFDDTVYKVVDRKKIDDVSSIKGDIGTIRASGGTSILPALDEGYNQLIKSGAKIKHMILLTDGQAERSGYDQMAAKISEAGITVSTVAVGQDSDRQLLEKIAAITGGRYYHTDEFANIPRIFAKEAFMAAKVYINNRPFTPTIAVEHKVLADLADRELPRLLGYIASSPKDAASVVLSSDENDPILSLWQYGLGKTAAWNSDTSGRWSSNYVLWDKNVKLWQNIINWTMGQNSGAGASVEAFVEGGRGTVTFTDNKNSGEFETQATIISPSLEVTTANLSPTAPGKYGASFDVKETGIYSVNVKQVKDGEVVNSVNTGLPVQYSSEYKIDADSTSIDRLVDQTGGLFIKGPEEIFNGKVKGVTGQLEITPYLIIVALILFILDIAQRRFYISLRRTKSRSPIPREKDKVPRKKSVLKTEKTVKDGAAVQPLSSQKIDGKPQTQAKKTKVKPKQQILDVDTLLKNKETKYR